MFHCLLYSSVLDFKAATPVLKFKHRQAHHSVTKYIFQIKKTAIIM